MGGGGGVRASHLEVRSSGTRNANTQRSKRLEREEMSRLRKKEKSILNLVHSVVASGRPEPRGVTLGIRLGHFR